ncbi:hypothetical protein [Bifidobacterium parmae]|uniref:Uncharacterized protein n=1 Tax=Bifidobacterium parmae TaxID=361854 RepID=A0A2N5IVH8_9BIFI|nr:hypothetical protein [Bifidobacterium parmae]PLS25971.1 hypothetical protein Uis4E_2229 [Bifidobacterium parmae]
MTGSRNLLAYGPAENANGLTCSVADDSGLHMEGTLTAGKGVVWEIGTIPPNEYRIRPMGDDASLYSGTGVYIAVIDMDTGKRLQYWDEGKGENQLLLLSQPTRCGFTVIGKINSTGRSFDATLHPMLALHAKWPETWEPPAALTVQGGNWPLSP